MAARPPRLARTAFFLTLLVAALALAPVVDALSARVSARASVKVDPSVDPSSDLPTWPTGTNDPCVFVLGNGGINVDTGTLLNQDCRSYVCISRAVVGDTGCPNRRVNPGTAELRIEILSLPVLMAPWSVSAFARDMNQANELSCLGWSGPGPPEFTLPGPLPPCDLVVPWAGPSRVWVDLDIVGTPLSAGVMAVYIGPPNE